MENFLTLAASVAGGTVTLSWTLTGDAALATSVKVQRSEYGLSDFLTIATPAVATLTVSDAPDAGQWAYRVQVTATQPDGKTFTLNSNTVDITVEATTGVIVLTGTATTPSNQDISGPTGFKLISLSWVFDDADTDEGVLKYVVQRSIDAGVTYRDDVTTQQLAHTEELPTGTGSVKYRVQGYLPNVGTGNQLNAPIVTTSNVVTLAV